MTPLLFAGALLLFGLAASRAQAREAPRPLPLPTPPPEPSLAITAPAAARLAAKQKAIKQAERQRMIEKVTAIARSDRARNALSKLIKIAQTPAVPASVRKAAQQKIDKIIAKPKTAKAAQLRNLPAPAKKALAAAVAKSKTLKPTPDQAAKILQIWTKGGGNQGTKNNRSETVKRCQALMGLTADGIIGPKTRRRARELGYTLAPRSAQKPGAVGYAKELQFAS